MHVATTQLDLPKAYGSPTTVLAWEEVEQKLMDAMHYWLVTTRPDGRPHAVPVDGTWLDGAAYFGGDPARCMCGIFKPIREPSCIWSPVRHP